MTHRRAAAPAALAPLASVLLAAFALWPLAGAAATTALDVMIDAHRLSTRSINGLLATQPLAAESSPRPPAQLRLLHVASPSIADSACPPLLRHAFTPIQGGAPHSLCQYQGKVVLVVNTASQCGFTYQYEGLEALYRKYRDKGLVVVGFPSNDFGGQEPGSNSQIAEFCRTKYGVQFPMYEKLSVTRLDDNPLYADLAAKTGARPRWNFHKYLIDRNGARVQSYASTVEPDSREFVGAIERLLAERPAANRS